MFVERCGNSLGQAEGWLVFSFLLEPSNDIGCPSLRGFRRLGIRADGSRRFLELRNISVKISGLLHDRAHASNTAKRGQPKFG